MISSKASQLKLTGIVNVVIFIGNIFGKSLSDCSHADKFHNTDAVFISISFRSYYRAGDIFAVILKDFITIIEK